MSLKIGGAAIAVVAFAALIGSMLPTDIATVPQRERIISGANTPGASKVRLRAAQAEAARAPVGSENTLPSPVIAESPVDEDAIVNQPQSGGFTGTAPTPQIVFADDTPEQPTEDAEGSIEP